MKGERYKSFGMRGKRHSKKTRLKMSLARKGLVISPEWCQNISKSLMGIKRSEETKEKIRLAKLEDRSWSWKGGISKPLVFRRFDWTCQICGLRDPEIMEVDHIKPVRKFPHLKKNVKNLQVLCPNCHARKSNRENGIYRKLTVKRRGY